MPRYNIFCKEQMIYLQILANSNNPQSLSLVVNIGSISLSQCVRVTTLLFILQVIVYSIVFEEGTWSWSWPCQKASTKFFLHAQDLLWGEVPKFFTRYVRSSLPHESYIVC